MKLTEVQEKAKQLGIKTKKIKKADLIREIQKEEGYEPCFQMNGYDCEEADCCWRKDCLI
ncbi:MAG: SAP domain-containing protein [Pseudomonadota bacterium]